MAQQLADVSDAIATLEQSLTFQVAGTDRPYRNLESILASEKSALRRKQIYDAATPAVEKISALVERRGVRAAELLTRLNLEPAAWTTELREATPEQLAALADAVLSQTQDTWTATLTRLAQRELQLPLERIGRQDLPRLVRLPATEGFKRTEVVSRIRDTLGVFKLDPAALKTVTLDAGDSPKKNPRGLVLGVVVPTDVRISLKPVGGARDQRSALHEFGHAMHDAFTEERRFELAKLGNRTNAEAFAALLESLSVDPAWLGQAGLSPEASRTWIQAVAVQQLFLARRAAGKVLFNVAAARPGADVRATYRKTMDRVYGLPGTAQDEARDTLDQEATLGAADYLRGWLLGAQLRAALVRKLGAAWWTDPAAGEFLRPLLAPGNRMDADGLARALGDPGHLTGGLRRCAGAAAVRHRSQRHRAPRRLPRHGRETASRALERRRPGCLGRRGRPAPRARTRECRHRAGPSRPARSDRRRADEGPKARGRAARSAPGSPTVGDVPTTALSR